MAATTGKYKKGLKTGIWEFFNEEPHMLVTAMNYKEDKLEGMQVGYFLSGNKKFEGQYENNMEEGEWNWYYEMGYIESTVNYRQGKKEGNQYFYSHSGLLIRTEKYSNGILVSEEIKDSHPILNEAVKDEGLHVVPAYYELSSGEVKFL